MRRVRLLYRRRRDRLVAMLREKAPTVRVTLGDLLPLVALAQRHNYLWLRDFLDDEVRITDDLYDVLQAFRCQRPSA